jgi:hypothetical protein
MSDWVVELTFPGSIDEALSIAIEDGFMTAGMDATVAAQPERHRWTVAFHLDADEPVTAVQRVLADARASITSDPLAVAATVFDEYERRANEPTLPVLLGAAEIAHLLSVSRQRVHQLRAHVDFPAPVVEVSMGPLWDARAVERFAREWDRRPGRPAKAPVSA